MLTLRRHNSYDYAILPDIDEGEAGALRSPITLVLNASVILCFERDSIRDSV
jgi:hypothetical protein